MDILRLEGLSKYYTTPSSVVMGLSGINLSFAIGEFVAITGESGSGKSTLAHVLGGLLPYESGELYINGRPTSHYDSSDWEHYRRDTVSFISQNYGILTGNTVLENVISALRLTGIDPQSAKVRAEEILREVELSEFKTRRAGKLSSGQKQRLSIARALAKPSKILIADEPTGNLDRENSDKIISLLKKASEERLVILITHEFEEAESHVTRHIVLTDGSVVADAQMPQNIILAKEPSLPQKADKSARKALAPYITALTLKSRPVFSLILCLLLALTTMMTFVFLGTFTVALDDTSTKIYDPSAFPNGDPDRIVVMKDGRTPFSREDYEKIIDIKYVENLERFGYISDLNYHYRPEVDYHTYQTLVFGPNYHPLTNPDDYQATNQVKFIETDPLYLKTVPVTEKEILTEGKLPEAFYEVLSADPDHRVGDSVEVYIRNKKGWNVSSYIKLSLDVVGKTQHGRGLYFSDDLAAALSNAVNVSKGTQAYTCFPYDENRYTIIQPENTSKITLNDNEFLFPESNIGSQIDIGSSIVLRNGTALVCAGTFDTAYIRLLLVSEATFQAMTDFSPADQISLSIKDYAYADRVMDDLSDMGYITASPFRLGATKTDDTLAAERLVTLSICLAALALTVVLQLILLRAMFSALHDHYRLLSNIGLTAKTARLSLSLLFLLFTVVGECIGGAAIISLNAGGFERVVSIFKYLDTGSIILLFATHFLSVLPAWLTTWGSMRKSVFVQSKSSGDLDFSAMEEVELS